MPTNKELLQKNKTLTEEIESLKKELYLYKDKPQLGRSYANSLRENKELQEEIKKLTCEVARLKEEREDASYQLAGELEDINTRWAEDKEADRIVIDGLKEQIENKI